MKIFLLGAATAIIVLVLVFSSYFAFGFAPVSTSANPMPFEHSIAKLAINARLRREMPRYVPIPADEPNYLAGAKVYREDCSVCHGLPGKPLSAIATGLFPKPPALFRGKGVTDDTPGETYWKVMNGIRLTGMPGFQRSLSETQGWQVSVLLANASSLPSSVQTALSSP